MHFRLLQPQIIQSRGAQRNWKGSHHSSFLWGVDIILKWRKEQGRPGREWNECSISGNSSHFSSVSKKGELFWSSFLPPERWDAWRVSRKRQWVPAAVYALPSPETWMGKKNPWEPEKEQRKSCNGTNNYWVENLLGGEDRDNVQHNLNIMLLNCRTLTKPIFVCTEESGFGSQDPWTFSVC